MRYTHCSAGFFEIQLKIVKHLNGHIDYVTMVELQSYPLWLHLNLNQEKKTKQKNNSNT